METFERRRSTLREPHAALRALVRACPVSPGEANRLPRPKGIFRRGGATSGRTFARAASRAPKWRRRPWRPSVGISRARPGEVHCRQALAAETNSEARRQGARGSGGARAKA